MAQPRLAVSHSQTSVDPTCNRCGAPVRLFGIEPHPTISRTDLRTFVCDRCQAMQTEIVPLQH
jgi:hypothetical protein